MGMQNTNATQSLASEKLVSYGNKNPKASDTAEGIAKWWLKMPLKDVLPALESLVELGVWEKLRRDDRVLYRPK
jgi:hypothetical protein